MSANLNSAFKRFSGHFMTLGLSAAERGWIPDPLVRFGIRRLCAARLAEERVRESEDGPAVDRLACQMAVGPIAVASAEANQQHYEEPTSLFLDTLGPRLKYSCCYWPDSVSTLAAAEERALDETCVRARIGDGMDILELGCGWGSLTLWIAERYPSSRITAVSNSRTQRAYIEEQARDRQLPNVRVLTADMNDFDVHESFDRVISVEMFEHMHNYRRLLERVSGWMKDDGKLFIHVFAHPRYAYKYETGGAGNWMARNFFTGGVMPSGTLLPKFQSHVQLLDQWWWSGMHYSRTAEAWLANMSANRSRLIEVLGQAHGRREATRWFRRWRLFYLACAELWGFRHGREWGVAHYLFEKAQTGNRPASPEAAA